MNTQNNSIGIWISNPNDITKIPSILKHFININDIFIISDNTITSIEYGIISSFYVKFFDGVIAFTCIDDFISNKNNLRTQKIVLLTNSSEMLKSNMNQDFFKDVMVINNEI